MVKNHSLRQTDRRQMKLRSNTHVCELKNSSRGQMLFWGMCVKREDNLLSIYSLFFEVENSSNSDLTVWLFPFLTLLTFCEFGYISHQRPMFTHRLYYIQNAVLTGYNIRRLQRDWCILISIEALSLWFMSCLNGLSQKGTIQITLWLFQKKNSSFYAFLIIRRIKKILIYHDCNRTLFMTYLRDIHLLTGCLYGNRYMSIVMTVIESCFELHLWLTYETFTYLQGVYMVTDIWV